MKQSGVEVAMHGFDARSMEAFELFFSSYCDGDFKIATNVQAAEIAIVDIDVIGKSSIIEELRKTHRKIPIIGLSLRKLKYNDALVFTLTKPMVYSELRQLLRQVVLLIPKNVSPIGELRDALVAHIQAHKPESSESIDEKSIIVSHTAVEHMDKTQLATLVGKQPDIDVSKPQQVMKIVFDSKKYFLGSVKKAMTRATYEKKMLKLTNLDNTIIIDPCFKKVYSFVSESVLRPLCLIELRETSTVRPIKQGRDSQAFKEMIEDTNNEVTEWSWEEFLWKIALWTARGKVPQEVDINAPVQLKFWPNLTRLQLIPHALSIAAVMRGTPLTLNAIARKLNIEQRFVFSFFTAAYTLDIAENSRQQSDTIFQSESTPLGENRQSMFQKLFGFLGESTGSENSEKKTGEK